MFDTRTMARVGGVLAMLNGRYLIGAAVEQDVLDDVESLLRSRPSVDDVHAVRSQRLAPDAFAYKCEVDFISVPFRRNCQFNQPCRRRRAWEGWGVGEGCVTCV